MLRSFIYTTLFAASFGAFTYVASQHVIADETRLSRAEVDLAALRREVDELKNRVQSPPFPLPVEPPSQVERPAADKVYAVPVGDAPSRGPADAWVTIIEFADYQCPFCARVEEALAAVRERYGDDVRLVFQHQPLPFHDKALDAAVAVECAGEQGLFWLMHDAVFAQQRELKSLQVQTFADAVAGLDRGRFASCLAGPYARERVANDQRLAQRFGATGTPTFFVNGRIVVGAQPPDMFFRVIDDALAVAKASGIARGDYYQRAVLDAGAPGLGAPGL